MTIYEERLAILGIYRFHWDSNIRCCCSCILNNFKWRHWLQEAIRDLLHRASKQFQPEDVSVATKELAEQLKVKFHLDTQVFYGEEGLVEVAAGTDAEMVVTAIVGSVGLRSTLAAIEAGKQSD